MDEIQRAKIEAINQAVSNAGLDEKGKTARALWNVFLYDELYVRPFEKFKKFFPVEPQS